MRYALLKSMCDMYRSYKAFSTEPVLSAV